VVPSVISAVGVKQASGTSEQSNILPISFQSAPHPCGADFFVYVLITEIIWWKEILFVPLQKISF
jgi:hypothetical protein